MYRTSQIFICARNHYCSFEMLDKVPLRLVVERRSSNPKVRGSNPAKDYFFEKFVFYGGSVLALQ